MAQQAQTADRTRRCPLMSVRLPREMIRGAWLYSFAGRRSMVLLEIRVFNFAFCGDGLSQVHDGAGFNCDRMCCSGCHTGYIQGVIGLDESY